MTQLRLNGCRSDSLLGYLKALGVMRLLATHADATVRGSWDEAVFIIDTVLMPEECLAFFRDSYSPTPILNPWNNKSGFDGESPAAETAIRRLARTTSVRWEPYRQALSFVNLRYVETGLRNRYLDVGDKHGLVRDLRANCPERMLPWIDASVVLTAGNLAFPYLFGSGGNDGRLEFSVNFISRALDTCGADQLAHTGDLLSDSLYDSATARLLQDVAIGQFSARHAGGANATSGFGADSLVNPWDYVLMMEGALLFSGSIARRTERALGQPVFPFALRSVAGGYGSASAEEQSRGELWLPIWNGRASLASLGDMLRKGRIDLPGDGSSVVRSASMASEAAAAVVTLGVPLGLRRLERVTFVQRNGLAFSAASVGPIRVGDRYDHGIAVISRDVASWIERVRRMELGINARDALRVLDERLFAFASLPADRVVRSLARQEILVAVADLDRALARTRREDVREAPKLDASIVPDLDDGSCAHRCALSIASLGASHYRTDMRAELRVAGDDAIQILRESIESRVRSDAKEPEAGWMRPSCSVSADDAAIFLEFGIRERLRFSRLLRSYGLIRLSKVNACEGQLDPVGALPAAYAVLKLVFDHPKARDERILRRLFTGSTLRSLELAFQRARAIRDLPCAPRNVSAVHLDDPQWTAAALALPIGRTVADYRKVLNAALVTRIPRSKDGDAIVDAYLASIA